MAGLGRVERGAVAGALVGILALAGCAAPSVEARAVGPTTVLMRVGGSDIEEQAAFVGSIDVESGCLVARAEGGDVIGIVLPDEARVADRAGGLEVEFDGLVTEVGDPVLLGGGYREAASVGSVPDECEHSEYFQPNARQGAEPAE